MKALTERLRDLEVAVADGRVSHEMRKTFEKLAAAHPSDFDQQIAARQPNLIVADRNYWAEDPRRERDYAAEAVHRLGIPASELI